MTRVVVAVDPEVSVSHVDLAKAWSNDEEAAAIGLAAVEAADAQVFLPGLVEWVVIPLAVNVASAGLVELVRRLILSLRRPEDSTNLEVIEVNAANGDRVVIVRASRTRR